MRALQRLESSHRGQLGHLVLRLRPALAHRADAQRHVLGMMSGRLRQAALHRREALEGELSALCAGLEGAAPLKPLERGFALVSDGRGAVRRSVLQILPGETLSLTFADGSCRVTVEAVFPAQDAVSGTRLPAGEADGAERDLSSRRP